MTRGSMARNADAYNRYKPNLGRRCSQWRWRDYDTSKTWQQSNRGAIRDHGAPCTSPSKAADRTALLGALKSLYDDRLEPLALHVVRRVEERTGMRWTQDMLKDAARGTPGVRVEEKPGSNNRVWIYLDHEAPFVGFAANEDPYPQDLWNELHQLIGESSPEWQTAPWPSSCYDFARALRERLPSLNDYKLGEVCHIVQLAVKVHHILGYREGRLVPYHESIDYEKRLRAEHLKPTEGGQRTRERYVTTWQQARETIDQLLSEEAEGIPLSTLKDKFRKNDLELSETVLGHTKLTDLIEDPELACVCKLEICETDRFVRRVDFAQEKVNTRHWGRSMTWPLPEKALEVLADADDKSTAPSSCQENEEPLSVYDWQPLVMNTFIHLADPGHQHVTRRSKSCGALL